MEHLSFRDELNHYKEHIDIRDYLERSGYTLDKSRDTPRYRAYSSQENGDKIYIPKNSRYGIANYYVNQHDNDDKGTIVDFVMSREKKTLDETRLTLRDFHQGYVPAKELQQEDLPDEGSKKKKQEYMVQKIATENPSGLDEVYLEKRLLSAATRHHPAFEDKVRLNEVSEERWIVFPLENQQGKATGLAMKGDSKERILGEKSGLWVSNPTLGTEKIDKLIITEHPIDAMSYHQLHGALQKQNIVYLATAGNPSHKQMDAIEQKANLLQPGEIILANDNDKAGQQYNDKYLAKLQDTGIPISIEKPQFKDWNADVKATILYQSRLLDRNIGHPDQAQQNHKIKSSPELEDIIQYKRYHELSPQQKEELPSYYVERNIEGKKVVFSFKEMAFVNNDQKLAALLELPAEKKQLNKAFVTNKNQIVEDQALLTKKEENALSNREEPSITKTRISRIQEQTNKGKAAFQDAESYLENQASRQKNPLPRHELSENREALNNESFTDTQKRYNRQIDALQQQIAGNPSHEEMSRKLHYYKNYPHLNDQEIEIYLSIEEKMNSQQQGHTQTLGRQQSREIGT